jgi:hypothetical protein
MAMKTSMAAENLRREKKVKYRYDTSGRWYKGNLHLHTVRSDGCLTLDKVARKYAGEKFDFISVTDHWSLPEFNGELESLPLLVIPGIELDGCDTAGVYYHVLAIGVSLKLAIGIRNFLKVMQTAYVQGAVLIWAHPHWTGNTPREGLQHKFHGMEVYNHSSHCENGSGYALSHWDSVLERHPDILGFATDDSHFVPGQPFWKGGWIMVNAAACTEDEILKGIRRGNFYATQEPEFKSISYVQDKVKVETSPVVYIRLIGPRRAGKWICVAEKEPLLQAEFELSTDWPYARLEIENAAGKRAWSNPLWQSA